MLTFEPGTKYSRPDVKELAGLPRGAKGGNWDTGIVEHDSEFLIFANVGAAGRTGHDYNNGWEGNQFRWCHKNGYHLQTPSIQRLLDPGKRIHLFWRESNSAPFEYAGLATPVDVQNKVPVEILWAFDRAEDDGTFFHGPDDVQSGEYSEGATQQVSVNVYERSASARRACLDYYGTNCAVCGLNFGAVYGPIGEGYIHVHHLVPLADCGEGYKVDPIKDLRPICPNCHAMAHRNTPPYSIAEIQEMLEHPSAVSPKLQREAP